LPHGKIQVADNGQISIVYTDKTFEIKADILLTPHKDKITLFDYASI